ncbi:MAG: hypothetical protein OXC03_01130 [Flavobacteriaceae bacterium]|nr:hypothetical protein [Flavobacteriaceae bacterium]
MKKFTKLSLGLKLNSLQKEVLLSYIQLEFEKLNVRSQNGVKSIVGNNFSLRYFLFRCLSNEEFDLSKIKNVGPQTIPFLLSFFESINEYLVWVSHQNDNKLLNAHRNKHQLALAFNLHDFPIELFHKGAIFPIVSYLLNNRLLFDKKKHDVYVQSFEIYSDSKPKHFNDLADELGISPERVRQIKQNFLHDLDKELSILSQFEEDFNSRYGIDTSTSHIELSNSSYDKINQQNGTKFSKQFILKILSHSVSDSHELVGEFFDIFKHRNSQARSRHNWKNLYLINYLYSQALDFKSLINELHREINKRHRAEKKIDFNSLIAKHLQVHNLVDQKTIHSIALTIINGEFTEVEFRDGLLTVKRNTKVLFHEFSYAALEDIGHPAHLNEIQNKLTELYPKKEFKIDQIRSSLKRVNGFVPIGRSSVFALKKWEQMSENFKGGTIREIVLEYLENQSEPIHIKKVTEYVKKFRPSTSLGSINANLRLMNPNPFVNFIGGLIGLKNKIYDLKYETAKKGVIKEQWNESYNRLVTYLEVNDGFPFPENLYGQTENLYNWYILQRKRYFESELSDQKSSLFADLLEKYPRVDLVSNWKKVSQSSA